MKHQNCNFGNKCKYFHPKGLNKVSQSEKNADLKVHEGNDTYANVVKKSLQQQQVPSNVPFLGLTQPVQQIGQVHHVQHQPFLWAAKSYPTGFFRNTKEPKTNVGSIHESQSKSDEDVQLSNYEQP